MTTTIPRASRGEHGHYLAIHTNTAILDSLQAWHHEHGTTPTKSDWAYSRPVGAADRSTIRKRFGSWSAALMAAGLEPNTVGRKKNR